MAETQKQNYTISTAYLSDLQRRLKRAWICQKTKRSTVVSFQIKPNGDLGDQALTTSSGDRSADDAALAAIRNCAPFRPLKQLSQFTATFNASKYELKVETSKDEGK